MITPPQLALRFDYNGPVRGVNRRLAWSPRAGRAFPDRDYAAFKSALVATIRHAMGGCPPWPWPFPAAEPLALIIEAQLPPRMDSDALVKPIMDALELAGAVINDHQLADLHVRRTSCRQPPGHGTLRCWVLPLHIHAAADPSEPADPRPPAAVNPHTDARDA